MGANWWDDDNTGPPPGVVLAPGEKYLGEGVYVYFVLATAPDGTKWISRRPFEPTADEGRSD